MPKHIVLILSRNEAEAEAKFEELKEQYGAKVVRRDFEVFDMMRTIGVDDVVIPAPLENGGERSLLLVEFTT